MLAMSVNITNQIPHYSEGLRLLNKALAHDFTEMTKSHLRTMDVDRANTMGGKRSHYYETAANSTRGDLNGNEILIRIQQIGMQTKYTGEYSAIKPNAAKWLTIPADAEAYGKRARAFDNLRFVKFSDNLAALVTGREKLLGKKYKGIGNGGRNKIMYWLKQSLHDAAPDHAIIPDDQAFLGQASVTVNRIVAALRSGRRTLGGIGGVE